MWIAEVGGRVVGCFGIARTTAPGVHELNKVYLLPEARGRGTARKMLSLALEHAGSQGAREVRLWTDSRFLEGHGFYERNGFERVPVTRYLADLGRTWEFAFRKVLRPDGDGDGDDDDGPGRG